MKKALTLCMLALVALGFSACGGTTETGEISDMSLTFYEAEADASGCPADPNYQEHRLPSDIEALTFKLYSRTNQLVYQREVVVQSSCAVNDDRCLVAGEKGIMFYNVPAGSLMHLHVDAYNSSNQLAWIGDNYKVEVLPQSNPKTEAKLVSMFMRRVGKPTLTPCMPGLPRLFHSATVLRDNRRILIAGGIAQLMSDGNSCTPTKEPNVTQTPPCTKMIATNTVLLYDMQTGEYTALDIPLDKKRAGHQAVLLADGRVLIMGGAEQVWMLTGQSLNGRAVFESEGTNGNSYISSTAVIYNPDYVAPDGKTGKVEGPFNMNSRRLFFTATQVDTDGTKFLVAGGWTEDGRTTSMEMLTFNPASGQTVPTFTALSAMRGARTGHTATRLSDGRILLYGGTGPDEPVAEIFTKESDPTVLPEGFANWQEWPNLYYAAALAVDNGKQVVIAGGLLKSQASADAPESLTPPMETALILNMTTGMSTQATLNHARALHTAVAMPDGRAAFFGGVAGSAFLDTPVTNVEYLDLANARFVDMPAGKDVVKLYVGRFGHTSSVLKDGSIVLIGGGLPNAVTKVPLSSSEIFLADPALFPAP